MAVTAITKRKRLGELKKAKNFRGRMVLQTTPENQPLFPADK